MAGTGRRTAAAIAGVAVVLAVGIVIGLTVGGGSGSSHPATTSSPGGAATATGAGASGTQTTTLPAVSLADVRWIDYFGVQLPVSSAAGPRDLADNLAFGYTDSPLGALMAAINIATRTGGSFGTAIFSTTISRQIVGSNQQALLASAQTDAQQHGTTGQPTPGVPLAGSDVALTAFRFEGYTPSDAVVHYVGSGVDPTTGQVVRVDTRIEVRWSGGDWKVVAPPGGDWNNAATQVTSLDGYHLFGSH